MIRAAAILLLGLAVVGSAAAADRSVFFGGHENISEPVQGPLVAIGGDVTLSAPVAAGAKLVAGKVTVTSDAPITGDLKIAAGDVTVDGAVGGSLKVAAGKVRINGKVAGNATIAAGTLELGPEAHIGGKLAFKGEELHRDPAAQVVGGIEQTTWQHYHHERTPMERLLHGWIWTAGLMLIAAFIAAALPGPSNRMAAELRERPGLTLLLGFVALLGVPAAAILFMMTIIGIPIGVAAILGYLLLLLMGYVWLAVVVGGMLLDRVKPQVAALAAWRALAAVLTMLVIALLARVPYMGGITHLIAIVLGIGMITAVVFRRPRPPQVAAA